MSMLLGRDLFFFIKGSFLRVLRKCFFSGVRFYLVGVSFEILEVRDEVYVFGKGGEKR